MVGLDGDALTQRAETLSGGQKRRLSIALSTISRPKLVLLDEPTTGVDPESRLQIWKIINEIRNVKWDDGSNDATTTVLLTTHSMVEAECLASRIGILSKSQLQALGSPMNLKKRFGEGCGINLSVVPEGTGTGTGTVTEQEIVEKLRETIASSLSIPRETIQCDSVSKTRLPNATDATDDVNEKEVYKYFIKFQVKVKDFNVASLFEALMHIAGQEDSSSSLSPLKIKEWAVSGETMENVFIKRVGSD
jgi:ABC-type multidrug transport system ATPase subunit